MQVRFAEIGRHFGRQAMRQRALAYVTGLLSPIERKISPRAGLGQAVDRRGLQRAALIQVAENPFIVLADARGALATAAP